jgi:RNA polymerase sigma factor (sigma-70 family)
LPLVEKYSDKTILIGIKNRKDDILEFLYKEYYPQIRRIVLKHQGDEQDAKDLFQEALVIIFTRVREGDLIINSSFHNYFIVLCRFIWFRQKGINNNHDPLVDYKESEHRDISSSDSQQELTGDKEYQEYLSNQNEKIFQRHYRKLPGDCKRVLKMYFRKKSFREIAARMKYKNEDYARRKKYLSMQMLMKMINEDHEYIELNRKRKELN